MKCPVCDHIYPDTLTRCSQCGRVAPERLEASSRNSTLIEFPAPRVQSGLQRQEPQQLPDWRVELNEKVRAIKARRSMEAASGTRRQGIAPPAPPAPSKLEPEPHPNPIVAAALNRVRKASENAARAAVAVAPPHPVETPRLLALHEARPAVAQPLLDPAPPRPAALSIPKVEPSLLELDDLDALNDLPDDPAATLARVTSHDPAPHLARLTGGLVDLAVLGLTVAPFVGAVLYVEGNVSRPGVQVLLGTTVVLLVAFYFFVMLAVGGRTVGMAVGRTRVVQAETGDDPTPLDALLRVVGYFVAALPAGAGLLWAFIASDGRGWHDRISGTRVVAE